MMIWHGLREFQQFLHRTVKFRRIFQNFPAIVKTNYIFSGNFAGEMP